MNVLETERLVLRWLEARDAPFILQLVNEPSWLQYIGDRGVRTLRMPSSTSRMAPWRCTVGLVSGCGWWR